MPINLFNKAKKGPSPKEGITKMRETLEMLEKRDAYLTAKVDHENAEARKFMHAKNKRAALMCLKRRKTYESQIEKINGAIMTLQTQLMAIESANITMATMDAMRTGADVMKHAQKNMTVDDVDKTMEQIQEQIDVSNEIETAIAQPLGNVLFDDDELNAELEALEQENLDEIMVNAPTTAALPNVAQTAKVAAPRKAVVDEDAELRALEESLAM